MVSVDEALKEVLSRCRTLPAEKVFLFDALDRVLAEDIISPLDLPPYDNSAMDGYALKAEDTVGASKERPVFLKRVAEVKAGDDASSIEVKKGEAVKIMTGGMMPPSCDSVVEIEYVEENSEGVYVFSEVPKGANVRPKGESVRRGELALKKGDRITPGRMGLLSSLGRSYVSVFRRPRVGIFVTGSEVREVDEDLSPGSIRNSNSYSLYALSKRVGADPVSFGVCGDDPEALREKLMDVSKGCDIVLTTGGVSMGDYDFVRDVLMEMGVEKIFWKVSMKPGKPLFFGVMGDTLFFGLPGNPVSCMVSFEVFVKPAIRKMMGERRLFNPVFSAILLEDVPEQRDGRHHFARVKVKRENGTFYVTTTGPQGSGIIRSMAEGEGFIVIPPGDGVVPKGSEVELILFEEEALRSQHFSIST